MYFNYLLNYHLVIDIIYYISAKFLNLKFKILLLTVPYFIQYFTDKNVFLAAGNQRYLCLYKNNLSEIISEFSSPDNSFINCIKISRSMKILFCGTNKGVIRVYPWIFCEDLFEYETL